MSLTPSFPIDQGWLINPVACRQDKLTGLLQLIEDTYPFVIERYEEVCASYKKEPNRLLGFCQPIILEEGRLGVVNSFVYPSITNHINLYALKSVMYGLNAIIDDRLLDSSFFYFPSAYFHETHIISEIQNTCPIGSRCVFFSIT